MWQIKWLRRFIRRRMKPVPVQKAADWRKRLALIYMFVAWNACGIIGYKAYKGSSDWGNYFGHKPGEDVSPGRYWARTLNKEKAKIVRLSGTSVRNVEDYERIVSKTEED